MARSMMTFEIIGLSLAFLFVGLGLLGRSSLMSMNPCQMTYTTMQKSEINVSSVFGDVGTLYRHPMGTELNKNPVLFIPGNMGSADQVRSLSSPMHNKDEVFQYFAVHFHKPLSAIHGSILLSQAAFVNDALEAIRDLYKKPVRIMVVGHSLGGMVARTAVTMSNHPKACVVSDIIMLNTPNRSPAYSPDGSMEAVYNAVNKVWRESYYNESVNCKRSRLEGDDAVLSRKRNSPTVNMNQKCALCASGIRLLSVSGGDLDILVPAHLTPIDIVAPLARNLTYIESKKGNGGGTLFGGRSVFLSALGWLSPSSLLRAVLSIFGSSSSASKADLASAVNSTAEIDSGTTDSTVGSTGKIGEVASSDGGTESTDTSVSGDKLTPESGAVQNDTGSSGEHDDPVYRLSLEEWNAHIAPYEESVQYTVRSVQVKDVGFPIDHNALLWCRQLMSQVSQAMMRLVDKDEKAQKSGKKGAATLTSAGLAKTLPSGQASKGKAVISRASTEAKKMIAPVAAFHMRNATTHAFSIVSAEEDRLYMAEMLPVGYLQALAVSYVSNVWVTDTLKWYMVLAIMALIVPIRRRLLCLHAERSDDWSVLSLAALLHLEDLVPATGTIFHAVLSVLLPPAALESAAYRDWFPSGPRTDKSKGAYAVLLSVAAAVAARFLLDVWWVDSGMIHSTLTRYDCRRWLHFFVSLFAALLVRIVLLVVVYGGRGGIRLVMNTVCWVARATFYRKGVRKVIRRMRKSLAGGSGPVVPHGLYIPVIFLTAIAALATSSWFVDDGPRKELGFGYWVLLSVTLSVGATAAVTVARALLCPPHDDYADAYHLHTSLGLLYLPLILLSAPTLGFAAFALLGGGSQTFKPLLPTFFVFSSAEMNTLLSLVCVVLHLWTAAAYGPSYASLHESQPLEWVSTTLLGRRPESGSGSSNGKKREKLWSTGHNSDSEDESGEEQGFGGTLRIDGQCYHEDGGKDAIFEEVTLPSVQPVLTGNGSDNRHQSVEEHEAENNAVSTKTGGKKRCRTPTQSCPSPGVILGTTYRVVSCACAKDYRLKDPTEWCSFCQCKFCGGKELHRAAAAGASWHPDLGYTGGRGGSRLLDDISANVYLAVSLLALGALAAWYAGDRPHRHLYMAGAVAAVYLLRDIACTLGMLKP